MSGAALSPAAPVTDPGGTTAGAEPFTRLHALILGVCGLGFAFDLGEVAMGSALIAIAGAPPMAAPPGAVAWLGASIYVGAVVGAPLLGWLSDGRGRRTALVATLLLLFVTSIGAAAARDVGELIAWRIASGLALGAYPPVMMSYLAEVMPTPRRGTLLMLAAAIGAIGAPLFLFLLRALTPLMPLGIDGWRWTIALAGLGAGTVALMVLRLPESPRFLAKAGRAADAAAVTARFAGSRVLLALRAPAPRRRAAAVPASAGGGRTLLFAILLFLLVPWATIAFPLLTGAVLVQMGFAVNQALLFIAVASLGPVIGSVLAALGIERVERRTAAFAAAAGLLVSGTAFVLGESELALAGWILAYNVFGAIYNAVLFIYVAELFPTEVRTKATAVAWAANRIGSIIAPLVCLRLLAAEGPTVLFAVVAGTLALSLALLARGPRGAAGRPVA